MALFSLSKLFGVTIRESATDGSDFTNPDADYRRLFLGEDGQLHVKDSAGAVTDIGVAGGAGAVTLLEQHTASSSTSLDFTTFISSTYDTYRIEIVDLAPSDNAVDVYLEVGTGGGPSWDTGNNYNWGSAGFNNSGTAANNDSGSTGIGRVFHLLSSNADYGFGTASLTATNLQSTSHRKAFHGTTCHVSTSGPQVVFNMFGMEWVTAGTAATGLRFIPSSGTLASGTIRIYGLEK